MVWLSDQTLLAKDERLEEMTLLISVPIKSLIGTFQKFPYQTLIRVIQNMKPDNTIFHNHVINSLY